MMEKSSSSAPVGIPFFWNSVGGAPAALTLPATGLGNATTCASTTAGALLLANAAGSTTNFVLRFNINRNQAITFGGGYLLYDRLAHFVVDINTASAAVSPACDGTGRLAAGEGGMILMEVTSALSAAANTITLGYTNQAGTTSRTTGTVTTVASRAVQNAPYSSALFVPLQSDDTGVRSIENWNLTSGTATGTIAVSIVKPLALFSGGLFNDACEKEFLVQCLKPIAISDNACLQVVNIANTASSATFFAGIELVNN